MIIQMRNKARICNRVQRTCCPDVLSTVPCEYWFFGGFSEPVERFFFGLVVAAPQVPRHHLEGHSDDSDETASSWPLRVSRIKVSGKIRTFYNEIILQTSESYETVILKISKSDKLFEVDNIYVICFPCLSSIFSYFFLLFLLMFGWKMNVTR